MNINDLLEQETIFHKVIDYDEKTRTLTGNIRFYESYDIPVYVRSVCYYLFGILKSKYNGQHRINEKTHNIIFRLIYDCFDKDEIFEDAEQENMFALEYSVCLDGIDDLTNIIKQMKEETNVLERMLRITEEQKNAQITVIDMLIIFNDIRKEIEKQKPNEYLNRLSSIIK